MPAARGAAASAILQANLEATRQVYVHLGRDVSVRAKDIIGIFDMETATVSKDSRAFLKRCEDGDAVTNVSDDLPKSFVLCRYEGSAHVFVSAISTPTLKRRLHAGHLPSARIPSRQGGGG
jgi:hypothetical protein